MVGLESTAFVLFIVFMAASSCRYGVNAGALEAERFGLLH
jgi:hypothetical protein